MMRACTYQRRQGRALCLFFCIAFLFSTCTVGAIHTGKHSDAMIANSGKDGKHGHDHMSNVMAAHHTPDNSGNHSENPSVKEDGSQNEHQHKATTTENEDVKKNGLRGVNSTQEDKIPFSDKRLHMVLLDTGYFNTLLVIFGLLVCVLSLLSNIEMKVESKDEFVKETFDSCVKQISLMSLVILAFYSILHTDIAKTLDSFLSKDPKHLEVLDALLQVSFFLFCFFIIFCGYIAFSVSRITKCMRKYDEADVLTTAKEFDFIKGNILSFGHSVMDKTKYLISRMEFVDAIKQRGFQENNGNYFYDYMRASLMKTSMEFLKISRVGLFIALTVVFLLRFVGEIQVFKTISVLAAMNAGAVMLLALRLFYLESHLYPSEPSQYLLLKLNVGNVGDELQPPYKSFEKEYMTSNVVGRFFCGYGATNQHENMFWLKQNGPLVLHKLFEGFMFSHVILVSLWCYSFKGDPFLVFKEYSDAIPIPATLLIICLLPKILYSLVVVTRCGDLIDFELLDKVLISSKNENSRNAVQLIDALAMEAVKYAMDKGGDNHWKLLVAKQKTLPEPIAKQIAMQWESMKGQNDRVGIQQLEKYAQSQLSLTGAYNKQHVKEFIRPFIRNGGEAADFEEFMVFGYVIKNIIMEPLEQESMIAFFENRCEIPWKSPCGIHMDNFGAIVKTLNLKWSVNSQRHFLGFIGGGGAIEGMSPEFLVQQLENFQQACQQKYFRDC